ncbi:Phosphorylase kinase, gamma catalytic subunit, partial [Parasponia andersonii]
PSDTLLAGMKLGWDLSSGFEQYLTSWKSDDDPSNGNFTVRMDIKGLPQIILFIGSTRKIRVGPWNGEGLCGLYVLSNFVHKPILIFNEKEAYFMFEPNLNAVVTWMILNSVRQGQRLTLQNGSNKWGVMFSVPYDQCDNYGYCGANAVCLVNGDPICQCLEGFVPRYEVEWEVLNWSNGCKKKRPLECHKSDAFVTRGGLKMPDLLEFWLDKHLSLEECREECLKNCSCTAYANSDIRNGGSGCLIWFGDLIDIREHRIKIVIAEFIEMNSVSLEKTQTGLKTNNTGLIRESWPSPPLENLGIILRTTYKLGNLSTGEQIAVKRLSKDSRQGSKEFKNEVHLIAKLQHKNLVMLLGCCIQEDERILVYEYMPHKSLDHFIFGNNRSNILSWTKYFEIVMGIARGLLYLHQNSRLQIIHRDLKASNILLDINLDPKISDFGLARIFGGDKKETRTRTVVGTYGYMSPEYAVDGKFSVKSDVFSFGMLLLEIVSGKRNARFSHPVHYHNLLGHAWLLWVEGKALELMDPNLEDTCVESQVKFSVDRPTMNSVVLMLSNEGAKLPPPKQPGFFIERSSNNVNEGSTSRNEGLRHSRNTMSITILHGR